MGYLVKNIRTLERESGLQEEYQTENREQVQMESLKVSTASRMARSDGAYLSLWDMGGHTAFQASHNVFISAHGVYIVAFRLTAFLKDKLETDRLKKWIRLIGTFSSVELNALRLKSHDPPIIFVGTFLDELKKTTAEHDKIVQTIKTCIAKFPELSSHKFVKFCTADNSLGNDDEKLDELRGFITDAAVHQDQWDRELPTRWLKLEMDLLRAREQGTKIFTLAEVIAVNRKSVAPLTDNEIKLALEYLHCTRSVIYFREFDFIINDPQWLANFFNILITDDQFLPKDDLTLIRDLELYTRKGELTHELIDGLLSLDKNAHFRPHKSHLLALMEKFGLIAKILMSGTSTETAKFSETYTIPSKLMELESIVRVTEKVGYLQQRNLFVSKTLCFVFKDVFVPDELFHRIFAQVMRTYRATSLEEPAAYDPMTTANTTCLYSGFGCFEVDDLCRLILSMHSLRSTIAVTVISLTETQLPKDTGPRIRLKLKQILQDMLQMSNQQHFRYTHQLHCNFHLNPYDTPVQLYGIINSQRGVACKGVECRGQHLLTKTDTAFWDRGQHLAMGKGNANVAGVEDIPGPSSGAIVIPTVGSQVFNYDAGAVAIPGPSSGAIAIPTVASQVVINYVDKRKYEEINVAEMRVKYAENISTGKQTVINTAPTDNGDGNIPKPKKGKRNTTEKVERTEEENNFQKCIERTGSEETTESDTNISNRRPTPRELGRLARLVDGSNCKSLFIKLGLHCPEIQTTKWESQRLAGITLITKMFLKWTNTYPNQTFLDIGRALTEARLSADLINEVLETDEELQDQDLVPVNVWNRPPSDAEIKKIVPNVGSTFFNLGLELGLSPPEIEQYELGHRVTFSARMRSLLEYWVKIYQTQATIGKLLTAMEHLAMGKGNANVAGVEDIPGPSSGAIVIPTVGSQVFNYDAGAVAIPGPSSGAIAIPTAASQVVINYVDKRKYEEINVAEMRVKYAENISTGKQTVINTAPTDNGDGNIPEPKKGNRNTTENVERTEEENNFQKRFERTGSEETTESDTNIFNRRPTPKELGRLARLVDASNCERLFINLGLPYPEIVKIKRESQSLATITQITKMFLKWTKTYPNHTFLEIERTLTAARLSADLINEVLETDEELQDQDLVPVDVWNRPPSDAEIKKIVINVSSAFFNLCLELGLSPPIIEQHELGHPVTFPARMRSLLKYWVERYQTKATVGKLLTAMKVCGMEWHTTAQMWSS